MTIENIAAICHEANRAYCFTIGDGSQPQWQDAPEWQCKSAVQGVQWRIENPEAPISAQHEEWLKAKEADGWKYGPVKDPDKKTHPCLVPYGDLPREQTVKDELFVAIVMALRHHVTK
jgi:RyR domain